MKEIIGLALMALVGWFIWSSFLATDYSKPWWTGNAHQRVCSTTGLANCYYLVVSSDGESIDGISMPNGGFIEGASSECVKASQLKDARLCRMWDTNGDKWDITKE